MTCDVLSKYITRDLVLQVFKPEPLKLMSETFNEI